MNSHWLMVTNESSLYLIKNFLKFHLILKYVKPMLFFFIPIFYVEKEIEYIYSRIYFKQLQKFFEKMKKLIDVTCLAVEKYY